MTSVESVFAKTVKTDNSPDIKLIENPAKIRLKLERSTEDSIFQK